MDWIFDHFQLVVGIIIVVGYLFRGVLGARVAGGEEREDPRGTTTADTDEAERTRQIQEEIRRRILARQRGETPSPADTVRLDPVSRPRPVARSVVTPPPIRQTVRAVVDPLSDAASQAILDRQRHLEEQMKALRRSHEAGSEGARQAPSRSWAQKSERKRSATSATMFGELKADLYLKGPLRRAFLLREILGQPLGLETGPLNLPRR